MKTLSVDKGKPLIMYRLGLNEGPLNQVTATGKSLEQHFLNGKTMTECQLFVHIQKHLGILALCFSLHLWMLVCSLSHGAPMTYTARSRLGPQTNWLPNFIFCCSHCASLVIKQPFDNTDAENSCAHNKKINKVYSCRSAQ